MGMLIDDIASYLEDEEIVTVGTDLFVSELPFDVSDCLALVLAPSPAPNQALAYYTQAIDIRARYANYEEGYNKLKEIFDLLHRKNNYTLGNYYVYISLAASLIQDNGRDIERRHLFQLSLEFIYRDDEVGS